MSSSVKLIRNNFVYRAATWMARCLAVASVFLLGRSAEAEVPRAGSMDEDSFSSAVRQGAQAQVSYIQTGSKDKDGEWPPLPKPE